MNTYPEYAVGIALVQMYFININPGAGQMAYCRIEPA